MEKYIPKSVLVAEIKRRMDKNRGKQSLPQYFGMIEEDLNILSFIDTLEVKEVGLEKEVYETAEAFAKIIRANLTGIDKDVQYKFEQLYKEITGKKMYQGYND